MGAPSQRGGRHAEMKTKVNPVGVSGTFQNRLPKGWAKATLNDVAQITLGQSPPSSTYNRQGLGLAFFQGKSDFGSIFPVVRNWCTSPKKTAEKNDILISVRAPVGPVNISSERCCIGRGISAIRAHDGIETLYLFYQLQSMEDHIASKGAGTTFKAITGQQLRSIALNIAPDQEQKRIVEKIESILGQIDATRDGLERTSALLKRARQSILREAFGGRLVPQDPNDESAEILLKRIHGNLKEQFVTKKNLPLGWTKTKIENIAELIGGGTPSRKVSEYFDGSIIWLTPTEMPKTSVTIISESREKITELGLKKSSAKLIPKGAVLLTTRASIGYSGIAGTTVTTNQGFTSFDCNGAVFNYYLAYWLFYNKDLMESIAGGTTFKEISKAKLRRLTIPLPPFNEQHRIVAKIESILGGIDANRILVSAFRNLMPCFT